MWLSTAAAMRIKSVKAGVIGATSTAISTIPVASDGVQAIVDFVKTGKKPVSIDTGEKLVTDHPVPGSPRSVPTRA